MIDEAKTEHAQTKWGNEFDKLEDDLEKFREYFNKTKKCNCDIDECIHHEKAMNEVFGNRVDELWNQKLQIGINTVNS